MTIKSRITNATITVSALVIRRLAAHATHDGAVFPKWPHLKGLSLADSDPQAAGAVELLLGADVYASIVEDGLRKGGPATPTAQKTTLGWLVSGLAGCAEQHTAVTPPQGSIDKKLPVLAQRTLEQKKPEHLLPPPKEKFKRKDLPLRTHVRHGGRDMIQPPSEAFTKEYEELGHMIQVPEKDDHAVHKCYLSHHGVFKGTGEDAKDRVVLNGSANLPSGESLNSHLLTGPNLLPSLPDVLSQWRFHCYVITADMKKMYR